MAPKFWMELRFLTTVLFLLMDTAPFARQVVTIIGSISGVRPTAMEMPNRKASSQSPFVMPLTRKTRGTMISIKRISTQETAFTPRGEACLRGFARHGGRHGAKQGVVSHTDRHGGRTAGNHVASHERDVAVIGGSFLSVALERPFSPPVRSHRSGWPGCTKRSFASRMRTSAGTMSPAERCTTSPTTRSCSGISSLSCPLRVTVQVVVMMRKQLFGRAAASGLLNEAKRAGQEDHCENDGNRDKVKIIRRAAEQGKMRENHVRCRRDKSQAEQHDREGIDERAGQPFGQRLFLFTGDAVCAVSFHGCSRTISSSRPRRLVCKPLQNLLHGGGCRIGNAAVLLLPGRQLSRRSGGPDG